MSRAQRDKTFQETIPFCKDKEKSLAVIQIQEEVWGKLNNLNPYLAAMKSFMFQNRS